MLHETSLVWALSFLLTAGIVLPYVISFRRGVVADRSRKEEAVRLGIDRPNAQYPIVDMTRCIGCGTCVAACPEGKVLGIVGGTATLVNGLKCIGHGKCAEACPVGAITIGLGDPRSRKDLPLLDDWGETSVPGVFIAGELGGLALVKNAVTQGRRVVERIAQRGPARGPRDPRVAEVLIVGAGPAGLAAAATAVERGLPHVLLEKESSLGGTIFHYPRRKLVLVQDVEIPLWGRMKGDEYTKEKILEILQGLANRYRLNLHLSERVVEIRRNGDAFDVRSETRSYRARHVVLALGRRGTPRKLGVPGEELPKVMYQLVDAEAYGGQRVLVVGGGDSAVEAAIGLARQPGSRVALSYRKEKLVRIKRKNEERIAALIKQGRVKALLQSEVAEIAPDTVKLKAGERVTTLPNDYVLVCAGGEPPFAFLRQAGVRFGGGDSTSTPVAVGA